MVAKINPGDLTNDIGQDFTYDLTGQQTASNYTELQNWYDGDGLRVKRTEDGLRQTLYLRSSVLGCSDSRDFSRL